MSEMFKPLAIVAVRQVLPMLGGAAFATDDMINQVVGALFVLGSVVYHAYQMKKGQQQTAETVTLRR